VPCTRLSWPYRQLLSARTYILSYCNVQQDVTEDDCPCHKLQVRREYAILVLIVVILLLLHHINCFLVLPVIARSLEFCNMPGSVCPSKVGFLLRQLNISSHHRHRFLDANDLVYKCYYQARSWEKSNLIKRRKRNKSL